MTDVDPSDEDDPNDPDGPSDPDDPNDPDGPNDSGDPADLDALLDAIHDHLAATQELPVERAAARWIGEAEAVARDLADADLTPAVVEERLGHVESLLAEVEETGDETADEHLERAKSLTAAALDAVDSG